MSRIVVALLLLPVVACQAESEAYVAGEDYEVLPQAVRTHDPKKIEVNEVFSYHCPHCFHFEDTLEPWSKTLADDVDMQRTPAVWMDGMKPLARAYYTALLLKQIDKMHTPLFEAYQVHKTIKIKNRDEGPSEADLAAVFKAEGIEAEEFSKMYNSFGVTSMVNQAKSRMLAYATQGTPEVIINGKYRVALNDNIKDFGTMLKVADYLIEVERQDRAAKESDEDAQKVEQQADQGLEQAKSEQ